MAERKHNYLEGEKKEGIPDYSERELQYRGTMIRKMEMAKNQRDNSYKELDDEDYGTYYDKNAEAANSYLRPKQNKEDTRIVTGTTREKELTILSAILNYNFQPQITAFDENNMLVGGLGREMEDLVIKSREIENYDSKRELIYKEMFDQGTVFVEESFVTKTEIEKKLNKLNWGEGINPAEIKWDERIKESNGACSVRLLNGLKVYLGNIREFYIENQPYIYTVETMSYEKAESIYWNWERWKYVPRKVKKMMQLDDNNSGYMDWTLLEPEIDMVEVIKYMDKWGNELQIYLNGVMMLPVGFPLTVISASGEYPIAKGDVEPIHVFFAYSKSYPSKTKVDQQVLDEFLRLMILKTQQSFMPPLANNTNRALSRNVFLAGKITPNINPDKLKPIVDARGVTQSEYQMFELLKRLVDEKSVNPVYAGEQVMGNPTATQIRALQKQQLMKMGISVLGVIELERQLTWLRLQNILTNWTEAVDERVDLVNQKLEKVYRGISLQSTDEMGRDIVKVIEFSPEKSKLSSEQVMAEADLLGRKKFGRPVELTYLNPEILKTIKYNWYSNIIPMEKTTDDLKMVLFANNLKNAAALFGLQSLNLEYLKKRFAFLAGENPELYFNKLPVMGGMMGGENAGIALRGQRADVEAMNNMKSVEAGMNPAYSEPQLMNQLSNQ